MPIYEFECKKCGRAFEEFFRSVSEKRKPTCPACGSKRTGRLLSVFAMAGGSKRSSSHGSSNCSGCSRSSCAGCR
ncbi:MAG: zinc ribbon domain-containing protein [Planctomycetes bacterium]|nr:zinc ribbon domain-containing protein [Planctomycetota bacterium]